MRRKPTQWLFPIRPPPQNHPLSPVYDMGFRVFGGLVLVGYDLFQDVLRQRAAKRLQLPLQPLEAPAKRQR